MKKKIKNSNKTKRRNIGNKKRTMIKDKHIKRKNKTKQLHKKRKQNTTKKIQIHPKMRNNKKSVRGIKVNKKKHYGGGKCPGCPPDSADASLLVTKTFTEDSDVMEFLKSTIRKSLRNLITKGLVSMDKKITQEQVKNFFGKK